MVRVGAVQAEPAWLDLEAGVEKTIGLIRQAAKDGVEVLGFPEVFIPGYPCSVWTESIMSNSALLLTYRRNSLPRDSPQMHRILAAIKESSIFVVLGYSERAAQTCYIAQSFISPAGEIVHHLRKIKLTGMERNIWGEGGAESITTAVPTPFGRVGALCCAEHYQPLLRFYEYAPGVQIHVASWPMTFEFSGLKDPVEGHEGFNGDLAASQFMAGEGKCFVLVATQVLTEKSFETLNIREGVEVTRKAVAGGGHSMIYAPDRRPLVRVLPPDQEGILQCEIDLGELDAASQTVNVVGHSARPDLLSLLVNDKTASIVTRM